MTSEMELFFRLCPCKIVAVTGSDGKTTTTTLIAKILEAAGYTVHLGGNLGRALLPVVDAIAATDVAWWSFPASSLSACASPRRWRW